MLPVSRVGDQLQIELGLLSELRSEIHPESRVQGNDQEVHETARVSLVKIFVSVRFHHRVGFLERTLTISSHPLILSS